ncbi:microfibrillar-associated protein 5 isoform X2 [Hemicordylus capensis]|uniref:microfibrillar-associated protein 5 isoform X2 n=1 Tax=Hemicordylus capensis TaxID=884348 RepID=UPI002303EB38|nr:microfibrillar-associated protein 5 isoform X2 [Hemicordylus capensis]
MCLNSVILVLLFFSFFFLFLRQLAFCLAAISLKHGRNWLLYGNSGHFLEGGLKTSPRAFSDGDFTTTLLWKGELDTELTTDPTGSLDDSGPTTTSECREEQFPCTRLYSVHKPVKQCISYLCITSVRRTYMINKEICSRVVCKEDEAMQEKICRQMAGLPPRRLRRTGHPPRPLCRRAQNQPLNTVDAQ